MLTWALEGALLVEAGGNKPREKTSQANQGAKCRGKPTTLETHAQQKRRKQWKKYTNCEECNEIKTTSKGKKIWQEKGNKTCQSNQRWAWIGWKYVGVKFGVRRVQNQGASLVRRKRWMLTRGEGDEVLRADPDFFSLSPAHKHAVAAWDERHWV